MRDLIFDRAEYEAPIPLAKTKDGKLWTFLKAYKIEVFTNWGVFKFNFKAGYFTDLGSVPQIAQCVISNGSDDADKLIAYVVHDALYGCHGLEFETANELLRQMLLPKEGHIRAEIVDLAVTYFGEDAYNAGDLPQNDGKLSFEWVDK